MEIDNLEFIEYSDDGYRVYKCPLCSGTIRVQEGVFYGRCDTCMATLIDYKPAPHQVNFHKSKAKYRLNIGGFGSGKTTMGAAEVAMHALDVDKGRTVITAQTLQQVKEAVIPELDKFLPPWFVKKQLKGNTPRYELTNGHDIVVFASNDEEKLRSVNATAFWIIEASGVKYEVFTQLQARMRNSAAVVKDKTGREIEHKFMGIVESNPEEGWIRDEILLRSSVIKASKSVDITAYSQLKTKKSEKSYHSFLSASIDNKYLPKNFISDMCAGKTDKWIKKYIYCHLEVKEGVVYPEFMNSLCDPFHIPDSWLRIYGFDKGWTDETCLCCGAIDPYKGVCYIYDEYYESQKPMTYHANRIKEKVVDYKMYKNIQADPSVRNKSDRDGVSYKDYFYSISKIQLEEANNSLLDGIERVRDFMYRGKLRIFTNCVNIKEEAQNYVWRVSKDGIQKDDPVDRRNHLMDALRYLVMALPTDMSLVKNNILEPTKATILDRINNNDDYLDSRFKSFEDDGVYGFGKFEM